MDDQVASPDGSDSSAGLGSPVRQEFERWMASEGGNLGRSFVQPDQYANAGVQVRWRTWQACEAVTRQRILRMNCGSHCVPNVG